MAVTMPLTGPVVKRDHPKRGWRVWTGQARAAAQVEVVEKVEVGISIYLFAFEGLS